MFYYFENKLIFVVKLRENKKLILPPGDLIDLYISPILSDVAELPFSSA